jgi:hypothetical protein
LRVKALTRIRPWLLATLLMLLVLLALPWGASAAEVLQVSGSGVLQVGDRNRSLSVQLACLAVDPAREAAATAWLRERLPRGTRVNLRPTGGQQGHFVARVRRLDSDEDLSDGLIAAGLATPAPCGGIEAG